MSEADRIQRQQELMDAMRADQSGASQPVPMAGYPNDKPVPMSPSHYYQSLLAMGLPKADAQLQTHSLMQDSNMQMYSQSGSPDSGWSMEGEF